MADLKNKLRKLVLRVESKVDDALSRMKQRLGSTDPLQIITYRSYGTINRLYVKGRVLEDKGIRKSAKEDSLLKNLLSMYQRFESDELAASKLRVKFQGTEHFVNTDEE